MYLNNKKKITDIFNRNTAYYLIPDFSFTKNPILKKIDVNKDNFLLNEIGADDVFNPQLAYKNATLELYLKNCNYAN